METLGPCEKTGKACRWICEEEYDEAGEMKAWDNYCIDCYQWRDWTKEEFGGVGERLNPPVLKTGMGATSS